MASYFQSENPQFYKIILDDQPKLRIPRKFVREYGHHLPSRVMLKVPSGAKWPVEIVRSGCHEMWLENGWKEFAEYYSLSHSSFLVFQYEKNSGEFNVTILDTTATEIDYPSDFVNGDNEGVNLHEPNIVDEAEDDDDVSVEVLDHFSPSKAKSPMAFKLNKKIKLKNFTKNYKVRRGSSSSQPEIPNFEVKMTSSFVHRCRGNLNIPSSFGRDYMKSGEGDGLLSVSDDDASRTWPIKYHTVHRQDSGITRTRFLHFGWMNFARENHLEAGDVLKFELIDPHNTLFRVMIKKLKTT